MKNTLSMAVILVCGASSLFSQSTSPKPAANAGMDPQRLAKISARMKEFVDKGTIAGAVTLVVRRGVAVHFDAIGYQDLETKTPMRTDSIFQIRSMTKPVTAVGIMILHEEGRLLLDDKVEKYLPEFRDQLLVDQREGTTVLTTKKPSRLITIRDLLTHTSGMAEGLGPDKQSKTLAEHVTYLSRAPLEFEPGTKYLYSDAGFQTLGRVLEVAASQPYEKFIEQRILKPLGMKDSFFFPSPEKYDRIVSAYKPVNGKLERVEGYLNLDWQKNPIEAFREFSDSMRYPRPSWGMFSTALDMAAFHQMMLNGGNYDGVRILSSASVELMTAAHTGGVVEKHWGYGMGWSIQRERRGLASAKAYGHDGLRGTFGWVDPEKELVGLFMIQQNRLESEEPYLVMNTFRTMTYAAIVDDHKHAPRVNIPKTLIKAPIERAVSKRPIT